MAAPTCPPPIFMRGTSSPAGGETYDGEDSDDKGSGGSHPVSGGDRQGGPSVRNPGSSRGGQGSGSFQEVIQVEQQRLRTNPSGSP